MPLPPLQADQLYQALIARDARFDGVFFVGVTSTGIYCRPVCTAPKPRPHRCRYFASAAAAERRGFRPCLRCRPELAPSTAAVVEANASVDAVSRLARAAAARIASGDADERSRSLDVLAAELGVSARHLRRAVEREFGASPVLLAQTRRLLLAKQLLTETSLPVTRVALASGFRSVRRFNALFKARYRFSPARYRRDDRAKPTTLPANAAPGVRRPVADAAPAADLISLSVAYRPPYDWPALLGYLRDRATPGVESVVDGRYWRTVECAGQRGFVGIGTSPKAGHDTLDVVVSTALLPALAQVLGRVRSLLDVDADPLSISSHLARDRVLATLVRHRPGLRVPGAVSAFELATRAVLGQQVSVRGATTLAGRFAALIGEPLSGDVAAPVPGLDRLPVTPERLADATPELVARIGLPRARASALVAMARAVADGELPELQRAGPTTDGVAAVRRLMALPGFGRWTAEYVAMRGLRWPDAFPDGDLGLRKAMGGLTPAALRRAADAWRPWRAYAAVHLWMNLGHVAG